MKKIPTTIKAERRELRKRPRMKVEGASVKKLQRIIANHRSRRNTMK